MRMRTTCRAAQQGQGHQAATKTSNPRRCPRAHPAAASLNGGAGPSPEAAAAAVALQQPVSPPTPSPATRPTTAPAPDSTSLGLPASPSPSPPSLIPPVTPNAELAARRRRRVAAEIIEAARKARVSATPDQISEGLDTLEALVPGFTPNLDSMKASEWARLAADAPAVASKIILLKSCYPRLDLARVLVAQPKLLLQSPQQLERSARQVRSLLSRAKDMERLLAAEPALMEPRALISVLITVTKWYYLEKDPIEVLEADPDLVRRAQDYDVPFEPVYMDEEGNWTAPLLNYQEKRTEWQKYIDQTFYKQP